MKPHQIELLAETVVSAYRQNPPIDPVKICSEEQIELAPGKYSSKFHGRIEFDPESGVFILFHPDYGTGFPSGRVRFSICHELGHYFIDEHREMIVRGVAHNSTSPLRSVYNRIEDEADQFAAALLLPGKFLYELGFGRKEMGLESILKVAPRFGASRQATLFRYADLAEEPCAVVISKREKITAFRASDAAAERGFRILGNSFVPESSRALKCFEWDPNSVIDGPTHTVKWFSERNREANLWEESIRLGETDYVLTLLSWH